MSDYCSNEWEEDFWRRAARIPKSGTRKIADLPPACSHPKHLPPSLRVYSDGVYEHVCPGCGNRIVFTVANPRF